MKTRILAALLALSISACGGAANSSARDWYSASP